MVLKDLIDDYTARPGLGPLDQLILLIRTTKRLSMIFGATASVLPKGEDPGAMSKGRVCSRRYTITVW